MNLNIFKMRSALQKEWDKLEKQESAFLARKSEKQQSKLNTLLAQKVPAGLQSTLDSAFNKAFHTVFTKGTGIIEKTYNKQKAQETAFINHTLASKARPSRKSLKTINKTAGKAATANLAVSTVAGVGLGALGIGIPDIVLFVSLVLKNMYQIATSFNLDYNTEKERKFILLTIQGALTFGEKQKAIDEELDFFIANGYFEKEHTLEECITSCSKCMSTELLYMKFLQGIPIVGAIGGAYDFVYMKQINEYAKIKYYKRFLSDKMYG
ncbi:MAG: EcsC family protein [Oscillospiraceae bacterium]|nr:EcsC family protein [Oscillospiraceae bacterium]